MIKPGQDRVKRLVGFELATANVGDTRYPNLWDLDLRLAKTIRVQRVSVIVSGDLFNALNSSDYFAVRTMVYSTVAGASYKQPSSILLGRLIRLGAVVNW